MQIKTKYKNKLIYFLKTCIFYLLYRVSQYYVNQRLRELESRSTIMINKYFLLKNLMVIHYNVFCIILLININIIKTKKKTITRK